jgi:hypothetical protein
MAGRELPALATTSRTLTRTALEPRRSQWLWVAILRHSDMMSFDSFDAFVNRVLCADDNLPNLPAPTGTVLQDLREQNGPIQFGVDTYDLLRQAAQVFLLMQAGAWNPLRVTDRWTIAEGQDPRTLELPRGSDELSRDLVRVGDDDNVSVREYARRIRRYLGNDSNNYVMQIARSLGRGYFRNPSPFCALNVDPGSPPLIELIWSYWMEESGLVQTMNAIALRFQNIRRASGPEVLADLDIDPLRPLHSFMWRYVENEHSRLSLVRRTYEYVHEYGMQLCGRAVPRLRPADRRTRFLDAFHTLLRRTSEFFYDDDDATKVADPFSLLNSLKELHLVLAEGAHNQFGDLPWQARAEMLTEQWILARPEVRDFLRGRTMIPYPEPWMRAVEAMNRRQNWYGANIVHFRDLAVFGERLLLSVRYNTWLDTSDAENARVWARFWRPEIQGYIHAYRAVTGVDITTGSRADATCPAVYLQRQRGALVAAR